MRISRTIIAGVLLAVASLSFGQAWSDAYSKGLQAIRDGKWMEARTAFQSAIALRAEDFSSPTRLPGPVTEQRTWRNGAPYSPNFGAAYAGFKAAVASTNDEERTTLMRTVASEFEAILAKNQNSRETFFFLAQAYSNLRDVAKQRDLETKFAGQNGRFAWRVDSEILAPEDKASLDQLAGVGATPGQTANNVITPGSNSATPLGPAVARQDKFALLIGNTETQLEGMKVPFAASDVMFLREKLVQFAGYQETNVEVVANATAAQMRATAQAMAERVTPGSTVFLFFSGVGANLDGRDFFAGVDTASATDSATMMAKAELYRLFISKGCKIFAFYQVNRPVTAGRFFGQETPMVGAIAQTQATLPGGTVNPIVRNGQTVGLFTDAIGGVLGEFRSNQVPITEFGWRVFNWMRGGRGGESGTGSSQTMTLPVIVNMLEDERF